MGETRIRDFSNYEEEYDAKIRQELEVRRMRRQLLQKHRVKITRCNILIVCEIITLIILITALILLSI